jgi:integrase
VAGRDGVAIVWAGNRYKTKHAKMPLRFGGLCAALAVKATSAPAGMGFHELRHYYSSLLIRHSESVKVVQARLGHASAAETLDTYSHLWPDSDDRTREALDAVLGAARDSGGTAKRGEA